MFLTIPNFFCECVAKPLIKLGVSLMRLNTVQMTSIAQAIYDFAILYLLTKYIVNMKHGVTVRFYFSIDRKRCLYIKVWHLTSIIFKRSKVLIENISRPSPFITFVSRSFYASIEIV